MSVAESIQKRLKGLREFVKYERGKIDMAQRTEDIDVDRAIAMEDALHMDAQTKATKIVTEWVDGK